MFCSLVYNYSTKDEGQKPFSFQIGKGAVIKGKTYFLCFMVDHIICLNLFSSLFFWRENMMIQLFKFAYRMGWRRYRNANWRGCSLAGMYTASLIMFLFPKFWRLCFMDSKLLYVSVEALLSLIIVLLRACNSRSHLCLLLYVLRSFYILWLAIYLCFCSAHRITHTALVDFRHGESSQTRFSTLKSKYWACSNDLPSS